MGGVVLACEAILKLSDQCGKKLTKEALCNLFKMEAWSWQRFGVLKLTVDIRLYVFYYESVSPIDAYTSRKKGTRNVPGGCYE